MHPLFRLLPFIKSTAMKDGTGVALELFCQPDDLMTYASTKFHGVFALVQQRHDMKRMAHMCPSRPRVELLDTQVHRNSGCTCLRAAIGRQSISRVWIHMHRASLNATQLSHLLGVLRPVTEDDCVLHIFCVDAAWVNQLKLAKQVPVDKESHVLMHEHRQSMPASSVTDIVDACTSNGFIHESTVQGDEVLRQAQENVLPRDIWTAKCFFLLTMRAKPHFMRVAHSLQLC